jgi:NAD(P)H-dependent FMN reductase
MILVISGSLRPESNSRLLAIEAHRVLGEDGHESVFADLRDHPLPLCDAGPAYGHPSVGLLGGLLGRAAGIIVATPIYNYDASAAVKNLIELTGDAWGDKVVGFLCAAGGQGSYMSILPLANSLMLDFRCVVVPRFVYATGDAFEGEAVKDPDVRRRVADVARAVVRLGATPTGFTTRR